MKIKVDSKIEITGVTQKVARFCMDNLRMGNPEYDKKVRLGKWTGDTPKDIWLYDIKGDKYTLPFGAFADLWDVIKHDSIKPEIVQDFADNGCVDFHSNISPFAYQEEAIKAAVKAKNGVIVMPCGSGKTQVALEVVARVGRRALWVTHTKDLLIQSMDRAIGCYDLPRSAFGTITDGHINIGTHITFATVQTLVRMDLSALAYDFDLVIVDECHKAIGAPSRVMMFYKVLSALKSRYKLGLTATPDRADGLERCMYALLGRRIIDVSEEATRGNKVPVRIAQQPTFYSPDPDKITNPDGTIDYNAAQSEMVGDMDRNVLIVEKVRAFKGRSVLVLSDRVVHLDVLKKLLNVGADAVMICGSSKKADRQQAIEKMRDGQVHYLFATYQLAKEGLDIPRLDVVVLAMPKKDAATVVQAAGRAGRKYLRKDYGLVLDFVDSHPMYLRAWGDRKRAYKKAGFELIGV